MLIKIAKNLLNINNLARQIHKPAVRPLWQYLNSAWNEFDEKRVEEVGPNRACAEWLLKCGAHVRFKNWGTFTVDYNVLPPGGYEAYAIEEILAEDTCIMARGFEYLKGCKEVKKISLIGCSELDNQCMNKLAYVRGSLQDLSLVYCELITDEGLLYLHSLKQLKSVRLNYLPNVVDMDKAAKLLRDNLPGCKVVASQEPDVDPETAEKLKKKKKFPFF